MLHPILLDQICADYPALLPSLPIIETLPLIQSQSISVEIPDPGAVMPTTLFADIFACLCFLRTYDVQANGKRFLPPSVLPKLNQRLLHPDIAPKSGQPYPKERDTQRIRLLHFLADCAGLIAPMSGLIKPTLAVDNWLGLSAIKQRDWLLDRLCTHKDSLHLWRIYQLPGWQLAQAGVSFSTLFNHLKQAIFSPANQTHNTAHQSFSPANQSNQDWVSLKSLRKWVPVPVLRSHPDAQPGALIHGFVQILDALGLIDWRGISHIRLRQQPRASIPLQLHLQLPSQTHPSLLTRKTEQLLPALYDISEYSDVAVSASALLSANICFTVSLDHCRHALARGVPARQIQFQIETALDKALPRSLLHELHAHQRQIKQFTLSRAILLESEDAALLSELAQQRGIRKCLGRTLSTRAVTVPEDQLPTLMRRLEWRAITPTLDGTLGALGSKQAGATAPQNFDPSTLAHLYLSARLCHILPDLLPVSYRLPFAVLADIEQHISPHDRALVQNIIDRCQADLAHHQTHPPDTLDTSDTSDTSSDTRDTSPDTQIGTSFISDDDWPQSSPNDAQYLALFNEAIENGLTLDLCYYSPDHDGLTQRTIEPLRLEQSGPRTYIIAYCHLAHAQRTFRLDRIRELRIAKAE